MNRGQRQAAHPGPQRAHPTARVDTHDAVSAMNRIRDVAQSQGEQLGSDMRQRMEPHFGRDFSHVRIHGNTQAAASARLIGARAYTYGDSIVVSDPGLVRDHRLMAHELAHVAQKGSIVPNNRPERVSDPDSTPEREAALAAAQVTAGRAARLTRVAPNQVFREPELAAVPAPAPQVSPPVAPPPPELFFEQIASKPSLSAADARLAMDYFRKIAAPATRLTSFKKLQAAGAVAKLIKALSAADTQTFNDEVRELLRWLQESETRSASGMDDDKMAQTQATFLQAEAKKRADTEAAAKAAASGVPATPAGPAEVEAARKKQVSSTSIQQTVVVSWDAMSPAEKTNWAARAKSAVAAVVAHATAKAPELGLVEADFHADFPGVEKRGRSVLAFGGAGGPKKTLATFGFAFVQAAEADPGYVMDIVVHEVFGHPSYGQYTTEYHLSLYDKAMAKVPGYVRPVDKERLAEVDAYAYQETEIYSIMRGFPYHKDVDKKDQGKGIASLRAADIVKYRVGLLKAQWEPGLAKALLRGLYQRYRIDARLTPAALDLFRDAVKAQFDAAAATAILN